VHTYFRLGGGWKDATKCWGFLESLREGILESVKGFPENLEKSKKALSGNSWKAFGGDS